MKRILSFLLTAVMLFSLASCGGSGLSDDEIRDIYEGLIEQSYLLNDVFYGDGLPFTNDPETMAALAGAISRFSYMPVDKSAPFQSEAEIREATLAVFSQPMCDHLFTLAFEGMSTGDDETVVYARYIEQNEILTVRIDLAEEALPLGRVYDFDSMDILIEDKNRIVASFATEMDGKTSVRVKITLTKTENGWRLDSPTY
mgnify:CR=1 FL=1